MTGIIFIFLRGENDNSFGIVKILGAHEVHEMHQEKVTLLRPMLPGGNTLVKTGDTIISSAPISVIHMKSLD